MPCVQCVTKRAGPRGRLSVHSVSWAQGAAQARLYAEQVAAMPCFFLNSIHQLTLGLSNMEADATLYRQVP